MNNDFEIKVTTSSKEESCTCDNQDDYDYEYDDLMNYKDGENHSKNTITEDPFTLNSNNSQNNEVTMWENAYETTNEND